MPSVAEWKRIGGDGTTVDRCRRIAPVLRDLLGLEQPPCVWCGLPIVLVDSTRYDPRPPRWLTTRYHWPCPEADEHEPPPLPKLRRRSRALAGRGSSPR